MSCTASSWALSPKHKDTSNREARKRLNISFSVEFGFFSLEFLQTYIKIFIIPLSLRKYFS